jgi:hypothetical protein
MTVKPFQINWAYPKDVEKWIWRQTRGDVVSFPSGMSKLGLRIDGDPNVKPDFVMTLEDFIKSNIECDTLITDPPFSWYNKFKWAAQLSNHARRRFILSTPGSVLPRLRGWSCRWYALLTPGKFFIRHILIYDRKNRMLAR